MSARFRRKEQVARGEQVAETREEEEAALAAADAPASDESDEDAALDDAQLLEKYGLTNPEEIEDEAGLEAFMENGLPDRLRQMALRRMWRLNPLFRFADEMVEYGENYTDAATVIDGMTTAYQVGKGYLQKAFDALDEEDETGEEALADPAAGRDPEKAAGNGDADTRAPEAANEAPEPPASEAESVAVDSASDSASTVCLTMHLAASNHRLPRLYGMIRSRRSRSFARRMTFQKSPSRQFRDIHPGRLAGREGGCVRKPHQSERD